MLLRHHYVTILTLIREFLGPLSSAFSGIIAGDVTVETKKMKMICADRVSVGLSYDANFKWHMPICFERCRAEQKYMPFLGPSPSALSGKNPKAQEHIQMMQRYALDFFHETRSVTVPRFGFFPRIHG